MSRFRLMADPFENAAAVTPHDTNTLARNARALYVGVGGTVKVTTVGGTTVSFANVPDGTVLPIAVKIVWSAGTTATTMLALY